ncbi:hypothetical protein T484DRAFT_1760751 [Baffinella frigidus]|nr:hypothetical protein T484DRAFT_1760751 [Cryptophyta sp. CCMP2293]
MRRAGLALLCCVGVALLAAFSIHHQPRVPSDVLNAMRNELAIDTRTITSLNTKVGKLDALVSPVHHPRRATALAATAGEQDKAKKSAHLQRAVNTADAKRKLMERQMDLLQGFKPWAANSALMDASRGKGQVGEWRPNRGPPYVAATTMFAGDGVDKTGSGDMIRRILGIKTSFRSHEWKGNNFITSFEGPQFRPAGQGSG